MVEVAEFLVEQEATLLEEGASVRESLVTRENMASSVMVRMYNFLNVPLEAVRTSTAAGEVEVPQCDVPSLGKEALLCKRLTKPSSKSGCAGTANFRIGGSEEFLHVMWSSPNNFDKHASHLAVGVSQERNNKFNDMSVVFINLLIPQLSDKTDDKRAAKADLGVLHKVAFPLMMQVLSEANLVCSEVCLPRHPGHLVLHARSDHSRPSVDPADIGCGHICVSSRPKASSGQGGGCCGKKPGIG